MDRRSRIGFCWSEMTVLAAVFWFVLSIRPGLAEQPLTAPPGLGPEARAAVQAIHRLHRPRDVTALTGKERTLRELELAFSPALLPHSIEVLKRLGMTGIEPFEDL